MKKILLLLIIIFQLSIIESKAQVTTNLVVSATPPSNLATWAYKRETIVYLVSSPATNAIDYKIKTEIQLTDGTVIGKTDLTRSRSYILTAGNTVYNADDVLPLENMIFTGKYKKNLEKTGKLPSDIYQICVQLVTTAEFAPLSNVTCKTFNIVALQLPILIKPSSEEILDAVQSLSQITFRWTPITPTQQFITTYKLLVFEVLDGQTSMQALRSNQPILEQEVRGVTQYIWMPQGILNQNPADENGNINNKKLVWTIQSYDNQEQALGDGGANGDGVSEPVYFFIANKKIITKE